MTQGPFLPYLLPYLKIWFIVLWVGPTPAFFIRLWTTHPCILYQGCRTSIKVCIDSSGLSLGTESEIWLTLNRIQLDCSRRAPGYFTLIGDKAPPVARDSSEVAGALNRSRYPHTGNGGHSWCLSSSLSLAAGFSIQDEAMDVARSAPQRAHYHAGVIYLLP